MVQISKCVTDFSITNSYLKSIIRELKFDEKWSTLLSLQEKYGQNVEIFDIIKCKEK